MTRRRTCKMSLVYKLDDDVQLLMKNRLYYMKLSSWIEKYPDVVYFHIYLPGKYSLVKITISKLAFVEFKKSLAKLFPDLFKQMIIKQLNTNNYLN
jgi:hypothetical protein